MPPPAPATCPQQQPGGFWLSAGMGTLASLGNLQFAVSQQYHHSVDALWWRIKFTETKLSFIEIDV